MHKNAVSPKTKAPPFDSSQVHSLSSDEETEDEEQEEGGSSSESGSHQSMDITKRKSAVTAAAPASVPELPRKRTRQSIGKEDEPPLKLSKPEVTIPAPRAASKAVAQQPAKKRATKGRKSKLSLPEKEELRTAEKRSASRRKAATSPKTGGTPRDAVQNGTQGGHAIIPEFREKSVRAGPVLEGSDEVRAENLALLRDMRGTCVKMVEEAKAQSLHVTEKILEATCVKTTKIVEEARLKSSVIMEELRLVIERLGTFAGRSGPTIGSVGGRWCDICDNPYQGMELGTGNLHSGDPFYVKWLDQSKAEQGLVIQRLQLVQDQARIQQERFRQKLEMQKQQFSAQ